MNQEQIDRTAPLEKWLVPSELVTPYIDWVKIFANNNPVEMEIGIGSGFFLTRYAKDHPEINIVGIDIANSEVLRSADKARRLGVPNIRTMRYDAPLLLAEMIAPESIENMHVYYSDPWTKRRHHRRRLWQPDFIRSVARVLKPKGMMYMKTDVTDYFTVIDKNIRSTELFECLQDRRIDIDPLEKDYETNFQRKAREQGHPLHYQEWRKI